MKAMRMRETVKANLVIILMLLPAIGCARIAAWLFTGLDIEPGWMDWVCAVYAAIWMRFKPVPGCVRRYMDDMEARI